MEGKTVRRFALIFATLMLLSSVADVRAADPSPAPILGKDSFFTEVGFITGFGYGTLTEGDYFPVPLIVHLGADMKRWVPSLQDHRGVLTAFLEPQFNLVFAHMIDAVAERLGRPFVDLDDVIVERAGKPIPRIFAEDGEPAERVHYGRFLT